MVIEGGINDLNGECDCGDCGEVLDSLVSADGARGDIPALVDPARADGAQVALVGYYDPLDDASFGFGACPEVLVELRARYANAAERRHGVAYVDPSAVIRPVDTPEAYRNDGIHPTPAASALVGTLIADAVHELHAED